MQKIRMGVCIEDMEYENRLVSCLMKHYKDQFELHVYTGIDQLLADNSKTFEAVLLGDCCQSEMELLELSEAIRQRAPVFYLLDHDEEFEMTEEKQDMILVEKYQDVNHIVDEIMRNIGKEIKDVMEHGQIQSNTRIIGVYSLSENEYQVPFAVTLASIIGEREKVLIIDMQENSGFTRVLSEEKMDGLEEMIIMAETGICSAGKLASCIGHMDRFDFVYPSANSESLCQMSSSIYYNLTQIIAKEMGYSTIIVNFGSRFVGFYEVLNKCNKLFLMQRRGGLGQWREYEFMEEINKRNLESLKDKICRVELPIITNPITSFERLIEQWKWNELGDVIRSTIIPEVSKVG